MEYGKIETAEEKPVEKKDVPVPERDAAGSEHSPGGESDAGLRDLPENDHKADLNPAQSGSTETAVEKTPQIEMVNGQLPRNCEYAGGRYPVENLSPELQEKYPESVQFNEQGYPDFSPYARAEVQIEYTGNRAKDFEAANKAAGLDAKPKDCTWHHHQDAKTMQLVPRDLHREVGHTGGCATSGLDYNKGR